MPTGPTPLVHLITPGDHYSPRTGSAIPTVVHGLSAATPAGEPRPSVLVATGTYPERYPSATSLEYAPAESSPRWRYVDAALARIGLPRVGAQRAYAAALADQTAWPPSIVLAHNAVQAVPLVAAPHRAVLYAHNQLLRSYPLREVRRILRPAAAILCVSESLADQTRPHLPAELHERVHVVPNGVDVAAFASAGPRERGPALEVMFVGRMIHAKGADVLVEAAARLARRDIHLTLVGGSGFSATDPLTAYEERVRADAATLPGGAVVRPFVPRAEVAATLRSADVVVVPSRWADPCPLTVLEGMAAGAAVIGSDIGGIPELLGTAGLRVAPDDPGALAGVLEALADDATRLRQAQEACLAHARANDWSVARRRLGEVLASV